jgi:two-component system, LytTR family, response regulator LytT
MRILIVEDERLIAEDLQLMVKQILKGRAESVHIERTLGNALLHLQEKPVDVLLLDLNLNSKDGFQILRQVVCRSFHTIVVSANINRAIEAFEYGVLDFIPKPYNAKRLKSAFERIESNSAAEGRAIKYLSVKKGFEIKVLPINEVRFFKSANIYVDLYMNDGSVEVYDKPIKNLEPLLTSHYLRIHKSYIIDIRKIEKILCPGGGRYGVVLKNGDTLPVSRGKINRLKELLSL